MHIPILMTAAQFTDNFSLDFNGTTGLVDLNNNVVNLSSDFTIEFWFKLDTVATTTVLMSSDTTGTNYWVIINRVGLGNDGLNLQYQTATTGTGQFLLLEPSPNSLSAGQWYHLSIARAGNGWITTLDTAQIASPTIANTDFSTAEVHFANYSSLWLDGKMDEVRFWDTARSNADIFGNMKRVITPAADTSLIGSWRFEEGSGTTAIDACGSHNGTLVGGVTYVSDTPF